MTDLTDASRGLFRLLWNDAPNWNGCVLWGGNFDPSPADNGNLTDLKSKGLVYTDETEEDGNVWVYITDEGEALAKSLFDSMENDTMTNMTPDLLAEEEANAVAAATEAPAVETPEPAEAAETPQEAPKASKKARTPKKTKKPVSDASEAAEKAPEPEAPAVAFAHEGKSGKLTDIATIGKAATDKLYRVDPADITVIEGWNVRAAFDVEDEDDRALVDSIKALGVQEPMRGYHDGDKLVLTNGHRRHAATMIARSEGAEIISVPFILEPKHAGEADHALTMLISNAGKPLSPMERATVVKRLVGYGWSEGDIAAKIGLTTARIGQLLALAAAPKKVLDRIHKGEISPTLAMEVMAGAPTQSEGTKLVEAAVKHAKETGKAKATAKHAKAVGAKPVSPTPRSSGGSKAPAGNGTGLTTTGQRDEAMNALGSLIEAINKAGSDMDAIKAAVRTAQGKYDVIDDARRAKEKS